MVQFTLGQLLGNVYVNCLLKGTLVKVSEEDWRPIETLSAGDTVFTHTGSISKIEEISFDRFVWDPSGKNENKIIFKIPAGRLGASQDTFISYWHKILHTEGDLQGQWRTAAASRIPKATQKEVCATNDLLVELYNLRLENPEHTFVVNGGVVVESWSGKSSRIDPLFSA